jgi:uncharacterized protein (TIGR00297 family)
MFKFLIGLVVGTGIAYLAYRAHALSGRGAIVAAVLGTIVLGLGGKGWALVLLAFFISSSLLSKVFQAKKIAANGVFAKGSNRDAWQVLVNGGLAGTAALVYFVLGSIHPTHPCLPILWVIFAASLAGANADTWGTELGVLNPQQPVLLTTLKRVPQGTSGGVSLIGTLAALAGSALVAGMAVLVDQLGWAPAPGLPLLKVFVAITVGGLLGSLVDSLLGATLQALYFCPNCEKQTEKHPLHICGTQTVHQRGLTWLNNDWVNFICTLSAALIGLSVFLFF